MDAEDVMIVELIEALPMRFVNIRAYLQERVVTVQLSDGERVIPAVIPRNKHRNLAETILEMLEEYPEMEYWEMPESMRQPPEREHMN